MKRIEQATPEQIVAFFMRGEAMTEEAPESIEFYQAELANARDDRAALRAEVASLHDAANETLRLMARLDTENGQLHKLLRTMIEDEPDTPLGVYFNDIEAALERASRA